MPDAYETERYEDAPNFNHRFKVETNMGPEGVLDHRDGFAQTEYRKNMQANRDDKEPMAGFPPMKTVVEAPKPKGGVKQVSRSKTKPDQAISKANKKDLQNRNLNK